MISEEADTYDYVKEEIGFRLADRLFDIKRTFETGADLGGGRGYVSRHILAETVKKLKIYDICPYSLEQAKGTPGIEIEKHLMTGEKLEVTLDIFLKKDSILFCYFPSHSHLFLV